VCGRASTVLVQAGTLGTVTTVYPAMRDAYAVHFDGQPASIRMWADELELADRTADGTSQL